MGGFLDSGIGVGGFDPTAIGGIPTSDPGINVVSNSGLLDNLTNFATSIGQSIQGVYNSVQYGNPNGRYGGFVYPIAAQPQVAGALSSTAIVLLLIGAFLIFRKGK